MIEIVVSEAGDGDAADIGAFLLQAWREAGTGAPGFAGATDEIIAGISSPEAIRSRLGGPDRRMYLARRAGSVAAVAGTRRLGETAIELSGIIVLQSLVGTGVGTPLLDAVVADAAAKGATTLVVRTESDNERALGFYLDRGFTARRSFFHDVEGEQIEVTELERPLSA